MASYCCLSSRERGSTTGLQSLPMRRESEHTAFETGPGQPVARLDPIGTPLPQKNREIPSSDGTVVCLSYRSEALSLCCSRAETRSIDSHQAPRACRAQLNSSNSGAPFDFDEGELGIPSVDEQDVAVFLPFPAATGIDTPWVPQRERVHSQLDLRHYLVPDLQRILALPFYWGVMDRHEADHLLYRKPEGTFLLRDSAQDEFLFSVSFRRYGRTLHARIEQRKHMFSFGSQDSRLFSASTVPHLLEHYRLPSNCLFYEPLLLKSVSRSFPFSLQALARAAVCSNCSYDGISQLPIPSQLQNYLRVYHYRRAVRVRNFHTTPQFEE